MSILLSLISIEIKSIKITSIVKQLILMYMSILIPLIFMFKNQFFTHVQDHDMQFQLVNTIDLLIYVRLSLSLLLFNSWTLLPTVFTTKKMIGQIENCVAIGYSAKEIWIAKSAAIVLLVYIFTIPVLSILGVAWRFFADVFFGVPFSLSLLNVVYLLLVNPAIASCIVLLVGAIQITTENYLKSSSITFIIAFFNMFIMYLTPNFGSNTHGVSITILYIGVLFFIGLVIFLIQYSKKITNEAFILTLKKNK